MELISNDKFIKTEFGFQFKNRTHNNFNRIGVNELGDKFLNFTSQQSNTLVKKL